MSTHNRFLWRNKENIAEAILMSTHHMRFCVEIRKKIFTWYPHLSGAMGQYLGFTIPTLNI